MRLNSATREYASDTGLASNRWFVWLLLVALQIAALCWIGETPRAEPVASASRPSTAGLRGAGLSGAGETEVTAPVASVFPVLPSPEFVALASDL